MSKSQFSQTVTQTSHLFVVYAKTCNIIHANENLNKQLKAYQCTYLLERDTHRETERVRKSPGNEMSTWNSIAGKVIH